MKPKKIRPVLLSLIIIYFLIAGCKSSTPDNDTPSPSATTERSELQSITTDPTRTDALSETTEEDESPGSKATATDTVPTSQVMLTPFPTPIPFPILTESQHQTLLQKLNDPECELPCYLGIIPGVTTFEQADEILTSLGGYMFKQYDYDYRSVALRIVHYVLRTQIDGNWIEHYIDVFVVGEKIRRMDVHVGSASSRYIIEGWNRFSISNVLSSVGIPDRIFTENAEFTGSAILFNYDETGIAIKYGGRIRKDDLVCPVFKEGITTALDLALIEPDSIPLLADFFDRWMLFFTPDNADNNGIYTSIPTSLGISSEDFSSSILANPEVCFTRVEEP